MKYIVTADTDIGISKSTNQDSALIKHASYGEDEIVLAIVCDGMGGLSKGEVASAMVIRRFADWFDRELPAEIDHLDLNVVAETWRKMLTDLNVRIHAYAKPLGISMGTTFCGILIANDSYLIGNVGDSRLYYIGSNMNQLTTDQSFVAREISRGTMTPEQAKVDKRRNLLLQCVGASDTVDPQIIIGQAERGAYMICSDGFRHEIDEREMYESLNPVNLINKNAMHSNVKYLINLVKKRNERDNITVVLIKAM